MEIDVEGFFELDMGMWDEGMLLQQDPDEGDRLVASVGEHVDEGDRLVASVGEHVREAENILEQLVRQKGSTHPNYKFFEKLQGQIRELQGQIQIMLHNPDAYRGGTLMLLSSAATCCQLVNEADGVTALLEELRLEGFNNTAQPRHVIIAECAGKQNSKLHLSYVSLAATLLERMCRECGWPVTRLTCATPESFQTATHAASQNELKIITVFMGHCDVVLEGKPTPAFYGSDGKYHAVAPSTMVGMLKPYANHIEAVIWDGCKTCALAVDSIRDAGIPRAVGWRGRVIDRAACIASFALFKHLLRGLSFDVAVEQAQCAVQGGDDAARSQANHPMFKTPMYELVDPDNMDKVELVKDKLGRVCHRVRGTQQIPAGEMVLLRRCEHLINVPAVVEHFVERPAALQQLHALVLGGGSATAVSSQRTVAMAGYGGVGKSELVNYFLYDIELQSRFHHGIIYISVGQERTKEEILRLITAGLIVSWGADAANDKLQAVHGQSITEMRSLPGGSSLEIIRSLQDGKSYLYVLDDVWKHNQALCMKEIVSATKCHLLLSTRKLGMATKKLGLTESTMVLDVMDKEGALKLLAERSGQTVESISHDTDAAAVTRKCGNVPLALRAAAALVVPTRDVKLPWAEVLQRLEAADLPELETVDGYDQGDADGEGACDYSDVYRALSVSLMDEELSEELRDYFLDLAVFPEDWPVPVAVLQRMWGCKIYQKARDACIKLAQHSLLSLHGENEAHHITLHDLQLNFVRAVCLDSREPFKSWSHTSLHERQHRLARVCDEGWRITSVEGRQGNNADAVYRKYATRNLPKHLADLRLDDQLNATLSNIRYIYHRCALDEKEEAFALRQDYDTNHAQLSENTQQFRTWLHCEIFGASNIAHNLGRFWSSAVSMPDSQAPSKEAHRIFEEHPSAIAAAMGASRPHLRGRLMGNPQHASESLLRIFRGHRKWVMEVSWSPDSTKLASGSVDKTVVVWDAATGKVVGQPLRGHSGEVRSVSWSPDGTKLASGSLDNTLMVWDVSTGKAVGQPLRGHTNRVMSVGWSPDGTKLASGSYDNTVVVWDAATGEAVGQPLRGHTDRVTSVSWSPDGTKLASGADDNTVLVWDAATREAEGQPLCGHHGHVNSVSWSPDGTKLASGAEDKTVVVWDVATRVMVGQPLRGHDEAVRSVSWSPDGTQLASGADDITVVVWDAATGEAVGQPICGHRGCVRSVSWSPDGTKLASGAGDATVVVWDAATRGAVGQSLRSHRGRVMSVSWSPNGTKLASGAYDKTLMVWDVATGKAVGQPLRGHTDRVRSVSWSPDGTKLASGADDITVVVWDAATGEMGQPLRGHTDRVMSVSWSPDGTKLASGSLDNTLMVWDVPMGKPVGQPLRHTNRVMSVSWSPDGTKLASGSVDNTVVVWDAATGEVVGQPLRGHSGWVASVSWSPDGTKLASGSKDKTLMVWDAATGGVVGQPLRGHDEQVTSVSWSPDGTKLASGSYDNTVLVWDVATGEVVGQPLEGHGGGVKSVSWSPDSTMLASGADDNTVVVWDAATGEAVVP